MPARLRSRDLASALLACQTVAVAERFTFRLGDFALRGGRVVLVATGNSAALDRALLSEVATWVVCYLTVRIAALRHVGRRRPAIWFTPVVPHPRYMVRLAAIWAGLRLAPDAASADAAFYFEDATVGAAPLPPGASAINFACTDISKSHVARVFADVFGYPLAVDPARWHGDAVEKSEANGTHDGRIVACPCRAAPGKVYQQVVDAVDAGLATDLRTHVVGGRVVAVWVKRRHVAARFRPANVSATLVPPDTVFSAAEAVTITAFAREMGADWAGLDILRDRASGLIYVVDVNKTDAGPIIALPFVEKLRSVALLAAALADLVGQGRRVADAGQSVESVNHA